MRSAVAVCTVLRVTAVVSLLLLLTDGVYSCARLLQTDVCRDRRRACRHACGNAAQACVLHRWRPGQACAGQLPVDGH